MDKVMKVIRFCIAFAGILYSGLAWSADVIPSTNEVDLLLGDGRGVRHAQFTTRADVLGFCDRIVAGRLTGESKGMGRHLLNRLACYPITTNTPFAMASLREKARTVSDLVSALEPMMEEADIHMLLSQIATVQSCPTGHLHSLLLEAREKDGVMPKTPKAAGRREAFTGGHPPNVRAALRERKRIERWNVAVAEYRLIVAQAVINLLESRWKDLPEGTRRTRIHDCFKEHGIPVPQSTETP